MAIDGDKIIQEVAKNLAKLNKCPRHEFQRIEQRIGGKFRCINCDGRVDSSAVFWYHQGLQHAAK
jgi:hypothetical protein